MNYYFVDFDGERVKQYFHIYSLSSEQIQNINDKLFDNAVMKKYPYDVMNLDSINKTWSKYLRNRIYRKLLPLKVPQINLQMFHNFHFFRRYLIASKINYDNLKEFHDYEFSKIEITQKSDIERIENQNKKLLHYIKYISKYILNSKYFTVALYYRYFQICNMYEDNLYLLHHQKRIFKKLERDKIAAAVRSELRNMQKFYYKGSIYTILKLNKSTVKTENCNISYTDLHKHGFKNYQMSLDDF